MKKIKYQGKTYVEAAPEKKEWLIPITVTISGHITVQASDFKEAVELARNEYAKVGRDGLEMKCVDVDFCEDEKECEEYNEEEGDDKKEITALILDNNQFKNKIGPYSKTHIKRLKQQQVGDPGAFVWKENASGSWAIIQNGNHIADYDPSTGYVYTHLNPSLARAFFALIDSH
jgi:hypothetical protein